LLDPVSFIEKWCDKFGNADIKNTPHDDNYLMCETFGEDIAKGYWCQVENEDVWLMADAGNFDA
jgi:hypothetical protein